VFRQRYLLRLLVRKGIQARYSGSFLGLLWSYIQPAIRFTVYYFVVIGLIRQHESVPQFALHLFCGIVFTHYFAETTAGGTRSIYQNRSLVTRTALPREAFPVSSMLTAALHTLPQLVLLMAVCALVGWTTDLVGVVAGLLGLAIVVTFSTAVAVFFSAINVYYRDFQNIVTTLTQFMHFMVPMMYPVTRVMSISDSHPIIYQLYLANPVADAVILLQRFFWHGSVMANHQLNSTTKFPPDMLQRGAIMLLVSLLLLWLAQKAFTRLEVKFPEYL
jgi:ABC-2 type transport system permease protein